MTFKDFRATKIDVRIDLDRLFALDSKVAKASPTLLPLETKQELLKFLTVDHKTETWVWRDSEGRFIGYLSVIDKPTEQFMEVLNIGVDPEFQGKGLGKEMMAFAERTAAKLGRKKVTLVTNVKNKQAIGFYNALGYRITDKKPNYYGDGKTRYLFEKVLS